MSRKPKRETQQPVTPAQGSDWLKAPKSDDLREEAAERARSVTRDTEPPQEQDRDEETGP